MNVIIPATVDPARCAAGARAVAMDQIEVAALDGDRQRMEFWVDRLIDRALRGATGRGMRPRRRARSLGRGNDPTLLGQRALISSDPNGL
jgi:hypothetical protein